MWVCKIAFLKGAPAVTGYGLHQCGLWPEGMADCDVLHCHVAKQGPEVTVADMLIAAGSAFPKWFDCPMFASCCQCVKVAGMRLVPAVPCWGMCV